MAEIALAGATSVLSQIVGVLGSLVVDEGSRLSLLQEAILWIECEMRHIQSYLEDAYAKQAQNRQITRLVEGIKRRVENINRLRLTYGINEGSSRDGRDRWDVRQTVAHVDEPYVVGFDKHIIELVTKLHNGHSRFDVISIVGMPGLEWWRGWTQIGVGTMACDGREEMGWL
ncbi:hypothetical protein Acr_11g0006490 [Actinidia rufa]|uniref:Disease resistance N-terminal domain-containing protein n=1 Tax=Actinidia rufa TaxID=165716 RepID=A0A7J0FCK3_9ERIC|nr:hypothetical protein Acr_11g0006490 [Actinidia rufa]